MKILAIGEVMMRLMPPDYKRLGQTNHLEYVFSGTGMNVLSGLYQMGEEVYLTTVLPDHVVGTAAAGHIRKLGIHDTYITYKGNHMGIYILEKGLGQRPSQITYLNRKESSFGKSTIADYDLSIVKEMDAIHICGISLAMSSTVREIVYSFAKEAKKQGVKVIFDCNFRSSLWNDEEHQRVKEIYEPMLKLSDIVFAGYKDATQLLGLSVSKNLSYKEQVQKLLQEMCYIYHIEAIFGTRRKQHCLQGYYVTTDTMVISEEMPLTIYDRVGGGDGFAAAAIHAYLHSYSPEKLISFATMSGVLAHTTYGDSPILSKQEILDILDTENQDIRR